MGFSPSDSQAPTIPDIALATMPPVRPGTSSSSRGYGGRPGIGHVPSLSGSSMRSMGTSSVPPGGLDGTAPYPAPLVSPGGRSMEGGPRQGQPPRQYQAYRPDGRASPAPSAAPSYASHAPSYAPSAAPSRGPTPGYHQNGPQQPPYATTRSATGPMPPRGPPQGPPQGPQRNMTAPMPPRDPGVGYYERSGTPQGARRPAPPQDPMNRPGTSSSQRGAPFGYDLEGQPDRRWS
jgi:hypothetical protein